MRTKNLIWMIFLGFGIVIMFMNLNCATGAKIPPCCPSGVGGLVANDPWVCPEQCPGGGKTRLFYHIEFFQGNEHCQPPSKFIATLENVTDNKTLPPLVLNNPKVGVYSGLIEVTLQKDTEFKLRAEREDKVCGEVSATLTVNVVDDGDYHDICFSGPLDWPNCKHNAGFNPFGPGVLIDSVQNLSSFVIKLTKGSQSDQLGPNETKKTFAGEVAADIWAIELINEIDCSIYSNLPEKNQKLCVRVFLTCDCPEE